MGRKVRTLIVIMLLAALLGGCSFRPETPAVPAPPVPPVSTAAPATVDVEAYLANMTLEEKVGQLFFVLPDALDSTQAVVQPQTDANPGAREMTPLLGNMLVRYPVGGVVIFDKNIASPEQLRTFLHDLQRATKTPLFFAIDEEGGEVSRLAPRPDFDLPRYQSVAAVGREGAAAALAMGQTIGGYLRDYGFTMDFAPVADVNTNPANPVIGQRAFSSDAAAASELAGAMAGGLRQAGIVPVFKHFPGHGDTAEDSHAGLAVCHKTIEELRACEWLPYIRSDLTGCGVMVGHIALPNVTGDMTPASLSPAVVEGILRGELGFDGLVITDALAMWGVKEHYSAGEAAVAALRAGCDVLLMPDDLLTAYRAVLAAVQSGEISEGRLDESVRRILTYKALAGLL